MKLFRQLFGVTLGLTVLTGNLAAEESITTGKVKSIQSEKREFILTEHSGKERTVKLDENVIIHRGGREGQGELKVNDAVCVSHETNELVLTAKHILIQEGESSHWILDHGYVKSIDAEKKEIVYTDDKGVNRTYSTIDVTAYVNRAAVKVESIKNGERVLALLRKGGDQTSLKSLYVTRK
jgi:hypothetical protein